mgnify:CR=1 FL=1
MNKLRIATLVVQPVLTCDSSSEECCSRRPPLITSPDSYCGTVTQITNIEWKTGVTTNHIKSPLSISRQTYSLESSISSGSVCFLSYLYYEVKIKNLTFKLANASFIFDEFELSENVQQTKYIYNIARFFPRFLLDSLVVYIVYIHSLFIYLHGSHVEPHPIDMFDYYSHDRDIINKRHGLPSY